MKIRTFYEWRLSSLIQREHDCYILPTIKINFDVGYIVFYWLYLTFEINFLK